MKHIGKVLGEVAKKIAENERRVGTPKSLDQAIKNGFIDYIDRSDWPEKDLAACIKIHVRDFLSQRFNAEMLEADDETLRVLERLWSSITGE